MSGLCRWLARVLDKTAAKVVLAILWVPATLGLAALPMLFIWGGWNVGLGILLLAGWGLAASWLRIFLRSGTLRRAAYFWPTVLGLGAGVLELGFVVVMLRLLGHPPDPTMYWLLVAAELVAIVLFAATVGARLQPVPERG